MLRSGRDVTATAAATANQKWDTIHASWIDDEVYVRQASVRSAETEPPHEQFAVPWGELAPFRPAFKERTCTPAEGPGDSSACSATEAPAAILTQLAEATVELFTWDDTSLRFRGRANHSIPRKEIVKAASASVQFHLDWGGSS